MTRIATGLVFASALAMTGAAASAQPAPDPQISAPQEPAAERAYPADHPADRVDRADRADRAGRTAESRMRPSGARGLPGARWAARLGGGMGADRGGARNFLRAADLDRDGVVTRAEAESLAAEMFDWRDRNGDGVLDVADRSPLAQRLADLRAQTPADPWARSRPRTDDMARAIARDTAIARIDNLFTRLDTDGDGRITAAEANAPRGRPGGLGRRP